MSLLSALVVFVSIAAFASVYASANHKQSVLMVTHTIEQGQPITAPDLGRTSAAISGGVIPIPVSDASELSGRRAAVTIPSGSLLTLGDTTDGQAIPPGYAVVGMALKPDQLPSAGLEPGDQVMVVETGSPGTPTASPSTSGGTADSSSDSGVLVPQAIVFGAEMTSTGAMSTSGSSGGSELVSVEVSETLAPAVSSAAASDQVSLVLLPYPSGGHGANGGNSSP